MIVYRDTNSDVIFEHPYEGPLVAAVYRGNLLLKTFAPVQPSAGRFTVRLTYRETQYDGELKVVWTGEDFERAQYINVRQPLVPLSKLRTIFNDSNFGDGDLAELENDVRLVIETHCGQKFGYEYSTKSIVGNGEKRIALPSRLANLDTIQGGPVGSFSVSNDGWYLYVQNKNYLTVKEMPPEEFVDNVQLVSGVIHVPDSYWKNFRVGAQYLITGEWGYSSVPHEVEEAAMLLAKDFGNSENIYRDRYLDTIKAGDWNMTFTSGAYRGTGNVRADQLLEPYCRHGMVII